MWEIPSRQDGPIFPTQVANQKKGLTKSWLFVDVAI